MNVVPLIDVLLVLLIIFMVITPLTPVGLDADLPRHSDHRGVEVPGEAIVVYVADRGALKINGEQHTWSTVASRLEEIFCVRAEKVAFVAGSPSVEFSQVARAIDLMRGAGVEKVGLLTEKVPGVQP